MARLAVISMFGVLLTIGAGRAHAASAASSDEELVALAEEAGVEVELLAGALNSQPGVDGRAYLVFDGLLKATRPVLSERLACIAWAESRNDPNATNRSSKAAGLFQFLWSTWATTPQGKAGLSPYDSVAATAAAEWMIAQGRINEWQVVSMGYC